MKYGNGYEESCPDCGEPLNKAVGGYIQCLSCLWTEENDGDRGKNSVEDYYIKNIKKEHVHKRAFYVDGNERII